MSRQDVIRTIAVAVGTVVAGLGVIVGMVVLMAVGDEDTGSLALIGVGAGGVLVGVMAAWGVRRALVRRGAS